MNQEKIKTKMIEYENSKYKEDLIIKKGNIPILFSAPHSVAITKENGEIKLNEPYTKAIALYLNNNYNTYAIIKNKNDGIDPNKIQNDTYKEEIMKLVKENNIKLVVDLHGSSIEREFDIEFGTLNKLSSDFSTIREFEEAFKENGITNIKHNDPFKGGAITQYLYNIKNTDVIQLEINKRYRDINDIESFEKLINSIESFIKQYIEYINR